MKSEQSMKTARESEMKGANTLRWTAALLSVVMGIVNFYYGNTYAGFYENLWYVMGGIYIFAAIGLAANIMPHFVQPAVFGYALFLISLWAVAAILTGAGMDMIAYADKAIEAILVINMAFLIQRVRPLLVWR